MMRSLRLVAKGARKMEDFTVRTADGTLKITLEKLHGFPDRTGPYGGYDAQGTLTIHISPYHVEQGLQN
jgi:hypothetical protein